MIGIAARFAGARSVTELWDVLVNGRDTTTETPADRYDLDALYSSVSKPGKVLSRRAGYLSDIDQFDADFFGMATEDADHLDPQQRLLMMTAWEAFEDAGLPPERIAGSRAGVYVGAGYCDYWDLVARRGLAALDLPAVGNFRSLLAGRLSYLFDLRGPSVCLDTACSSSLVAVHLAVQSLRAGETTLALAAGVSLKLVPDRDVLLSRARVVARDGRCKFADADADGAAFSDGVGVVVLKPLENALADGDRVRAVILGSAVSNDGASSGSLLTPSVEGHVEMLRWAYSDAGVDPASVDFVEAHGNGTPTMDPVEFAGLGEVLGPNRPSDHPCFVGSVKTNIGHAESAAGIAALAKTLLCLENGLVVPSLHLARPNPAVDWRTLPFVVPTSVQPLPDVDRPWIAGISGQGISSVNAHLVVAQADARLVAERPPATPGRPHLLVLSAKTPAALRDLARDYVCHLSPGGAGRNSELRDIAYSAAVRRTHHEHRLAVTGGTHDELSEALDRHLVGAPYEPPRVALEYLHGGPANWAELMEPNARFVPLPTYPWQTRRHWLDSAGQDNHDAPPNEAVAR